MEVYYHGQRMEFTQIPEPARKTSPPPVPAARVVVVRKAKKDHPWRGYQNMKPWILKTETVGSLVGIRTSASP